MRTLCVELINFNSLGYGQCVDSRCCHENRCRHHLYHLAKILSRQMVVKQVHKVETQSIHYPILFRIYSSYGFLFISTMSCRPNNNVRARLTENIHGQRECQMMSGKEAILQRIANFLHSWFRMVLSCATSPGLQVTVAWGHGWRADWLLDMQAWHWDWAQITGIIGDKFQNNILVW